MVKVMVTLDVDFDFNPTHGVYLQDTDLIEAVSEILFAGAYDREEDISILETKIL